MLSLFVDMIGLYVSSDETLDSALTSCNCTLIHCQLLFCTGDQCACSRRLRNPVLGARKAGKIWKISGRAMLLTAFVVAAVHCETTAEE
jgi:hypothetical protein